MLSSPSTRSPLEDTTNGFRTPTPPPPRATAKTGPVLRHKQSQHVLHPHLDSSESYPSPHDSIYEAIIASAGVENTNSYEVNDWTASTATGNDAPSTWEAEGFESRSKDERPSWTDTVVDSSGNSVPASFLQESLSPKKHTPHQLYPITEQNSLATLRPGASRSTLKGQVSNCNIRPVTPSLQGKKRKSFSTSDLPPTPSPVPITKTPSPPSSPETFYTPIEPSQPPPLRITTPPGLPTFNAPAASTYRLPPPPTRFRHRFRPPTAAEREWVTQTVGLPRGVVMRGEGGVLVRGKFTPIRSGHFPPQRQAHALFGLPGPTGDLRTTTPPRPVVLNERRVRFTGPRSDPMSPIGENNASVTTAENKGKKREEKAKKLLKRIYWVIGCCGLCEAWDLSHQTQGSGFMRRGPDMAGGNREEMPLFVGGFNAMDREQA